MPLVATGPFIMGINSASDSALRSASPDSSIECKKRRSSLHSCQSLADIALLRRRTASPPTPSPPNWSSPCRTRR